MFSSICVLMHNCVCTTGQPKCSNLKLSTIDDNVDSVVQNALTGTYQFIGEWKNMGSPIYRQVGVDPRAPWANKFYLSYGSKQWIVSKVRDLSYIFKSKKYNNIEDLLLKRTNHII